jgi:hypothetical protein
VGGLVKREEIFQDAHAAFGGDGFGVELHAPNGELFVTQPHDFALGGLGGDREAVGQSGAFNDQRVITGERLSGVPRDARNTVYWGKDSELFMDEVTAWLVAR